MRYGGEEVTLPTRAVEAPVVLKLAQRIAHARKANALGAEQELFQPALVVRVQLGHLGGPAALPERPYEPVGPH